MTQRKHPYGGKGDIRTTHRDYPDSTRKISPRPQGSIPVRFIIHNKKLILMSQKFIKNKNNNSKSEAYGKYYAKAVYDKKFIETEQLAE